MARKRVVQSQSETSVGHVAWYRRLMCSETPTAATSESVNIFIITIQRKNDLLDSDALKL